MSTSPDQPNLARWEGRTVLVTGAGGFIGSHLAERLVEAGARVRAMVHYNALGLAGWLDQSPLRGDMEIFSGDICDADSVRRALDGVDTAFHLAALIGIPYSYHAPGSYIRTNIVGTLNVLQTARQLGTRRVIHTSTSEVYGTALHIPIGEDHPLQGQSPYSASKIGADKMAEAFHLSFGLPVVTVRPFNTFGPRQSARAVIPTIITQALKGETIRLGSIHPTRDLNFVGDTVGGFLHAATADAAIGHVINLGRGSEISVGDLVVLIGKIIGRSLRVETDDQRIRPDKSEVERLLADNGRAAALLGWTPQISLEEGLRITVRWFEENIGKYRASGYIV